MAYESQKTVALRLTLSPALHRQLELAARNAGKPLETTIKALLWMGLGALNLKGNRRPRVSET